MRTYAGVSALNARRSFLFVGVVALFSLLLPWQAAGFAAQTAQQTPAVSPIPPGIAEQGPTTPPGPTSGFFILKSTPVPATVAEITFDKKDSKSIRLATRNLLALAATTKGLLLGRGLTFAQQMQKLAAQLTPGSPEFKLLLDLQNAWIGLSPSQRNAIPPIGSNEV